MIIEAVFNAIFGIITSLISFIPSGYNVPGWIADTITVLKVPLSIFPQDIWEITIANILFWVGVQSSWSIVEWVYKKLPGVS